MQDDEHVMLLMGLYGVYIYIYGQFVHEVDISEVYYPPQN